MDTNVTYCKLFALKKDLLMAFGERLRQLRNKRGLSQEDFAARCRLDRTYISGIERGRRNPSLRNIKKIAAELGVTMSRLFKGIN